MGKIVALEIGRMERILEGRETWTEWRRSDTNIVRFLWKEIKLR